MLRVDSVPCARGLRWDLSISCVASRSLRYWTMTGAPRRGIVETRFGRHSGGFLCKILDLNFVEWVKDEVRPPSVTAQTSMRDLVRREQPLRLALFFLTADG